MTDPKPKPRPRFQLHLSTCVVLMVVAGIIVALNLTPRSYGYTRVAEPLEMIQDSRQTIVPYVAFGWPFNFLSGDTEYHIIEQGVVANGAIALAILAMAAFACEYGIRKQERKRHLHPPGDRP